MKASELKNTKIDQRDDTASGGDDGNSDDIYKVWK
jgi:hypothetical protein